MRLERTNGNKESIYVREKNSDRTGAKNDIVETLSNTSGSKSKKTAFSLVLKLGSKKVITVFSPVKVRCVGNNRKVSVTGINPKNNQLSTFTGTLITNFDGLPQPLSIF